MLPFLFAGLILLSGDPPPGAGLDEWSERERDRMGEAVTEALECDVACEAHWCEEWLTPSPPVLHGWATRYGNESIMAATLAYNGLALDADYAGAIATKSPSDLGRAYHLAGVGDVLVGDVAAFNDWAPVGESVRDVRLGQAFVDGQPWIADLPNGLYYAAGGDGGPILITLTNGSAPTTIRNATCPDVAPEPMLFYPAPDSLPVVIPARQPDAPALACPTWSCNRNRVMIQGVNWVDHWGDDLWTPEDGTVYAPAAGRVVFVGEWNGLGNEVVLDLGGGWWLRMGHLEVVNRRELPVGGQIEAGQFIGWTGDSGYTLDGEHLHIELFWNRMPYDFLEYVVAPPQWVLLTTDSVREPAPKIDSWAQVREGG